MLKIKSEEFTFNGKQADCMDFLSDLNNYKNLFPKDCRTCRYRPNGRGGLYHQPYRRCGIAGLSRTSVVDLTEFGVCAGRRHGADVAGAGFVDPEVARTGP